MIIITNNLTTAVNNANYIADQNPENLEIIIYILAQVAQLFTAPTTIVELAVIKKVYYKLFFNLILTIVHCAMCIIKLILSIKLFLSNPLIIVLMHNYNNLLKFFLCTLCCF